MLFTSYRAVNYRPVSLSRALSTNKSVEKRYEYIYIYKVQFTLNSRGEVLGSIVFSHMLKQVNHLLDSWTNGEPHSLTFSCQDWSAILNPSGNPTGALISLTGKIHMALAPDHFRQAVTPDTPFELAHDREKGARNSRRRHLDVGKDVGSL